MDFQTSFAAIERGAALVYHKVLATGVAVTAWEITHPELAPLIQEAMDYALSALARFGVPVASPLLGVVGADILAALKALAAADATVPSVATTTTTVTSESAIAAGAPA